MVNMETTITGIQGLLYGPIPSFLANLNRVQEYRNVPSEMPGSRTNFKVSALVIWDWRLLRYHNSCQTLGLIHAHRCGGYV